MSRNDGFLIGKKLLAIVAMCVFFVPTESSAQFEGTAGDYYDEAESLAHAWQSNAELVLMGGAADDMWADGEAPVWMFFFRSSSVDSLLWVIVTLGFPVSDVVNDTIGILGAIPDGWVDSDLATSVAEANGGSEFRNQTGRDFVVATAGRGLYLQEILRPVWMIAYTDTSLVSLIVYIDLATGEFLDAHVVGIGERPGSGHELPRAYSLSQNYPNPFNPSTTLEYTIPAGSEMPVSIGVYDLRGRKLKTLYQGARGPGAYQVHWNGKDDRGADVGVGLYLAKLVAGGNVLVRKMTLVK